jgi:DNA-directed RNA polymerase sigma subunit (sigma70/sigma32)
MSKVATCVPDEPLAIVRSLALRQHIHSLSAEKREVVEMLYGIGRGRLDLAQTASRLKKRVDEVRQIRNAALRELGKRVVMEAAV